MNLLVKFIGIVILVIGISANSHAEPTVVQAKLSVQANNGFIAYLNGHFIGKGQGFHTVFRDIPVDTSWFHPCGPQILGTYFYDSQGYWTFVIYKLEVVLSDGTTKTYFSDGDERIFDLETAGQARRIDQLPVPHGWNTEPYLFSTEGWKGSGRCVSSNKGMREIMSQMKHPSMPGGTVPAIRPPIVSAECEVKEAFDSFLVREVFELGPCKEATPVPLNFDSGQRINAGGGFRFLDASNEKWEIDKHTVDEFIETENKKSRKNRVISGRKVVAISNTEDDNLYHSYATTKGKKLSYAINVSKPGTYQVRLRFSEPKGRGRSFDIAAEGIMAFENFSPYKEAGNKNDTAVDKIFAVKVLDGILNIDLLKRKGRPIISGIEIVRADPNAKTISHKIEATKIMTPTPSQTPTRYPTETPAVAPTREPIAVRTVLAPVIVHTRIPSPTLVPTRSWIGLKQRSTITTSWKLLDLFYNFIGESKRGTVSFHAFRKIEFLESDNAATGKNIGQRVRVELEDGSKWEFYDFKRTIPRTGGKEANMVYHFGPELRKVHFSDIKQVSILGDLSAFEDNSGEVRFEYVFRE